MLNKKFNAKILLLGEHLINLGSDALSMPYSKFKGQLSITTKSDPRLELYIKFLEEQQFDFLDSDKLSTHKPLEFISNIPEGYGCGSSGAIVAACYDYFKSSQTKNTTELKKYFSKMEAFYHGKSSGTDPLISYLNSAIRFNSNGEILLLDGFLPELTDYKLVLIDSAKSRDGKEYINWFMEKSKQADFKHKLETELIPHTQNCIDSLVSGSRHSFLTSYQSISQFQLNHFDQMIPDNIRHLWQSGLESEKLYMKICGAGGGGFFIGLLKDGIEPAALPEFKYYSLF